MKKSRPIIVAQVMGKMVGGGVESVIMNYYRHINRDKIQFDFICDEDSTNIPYDEIEKLGGRVILVPPYQKIFKYIKILKKIFKENNYKIVHSNINTLSVFPLYAAKKAGIPIRIAHSHSTIVNNKSEWKRNVLKNVLKLFSKTYATNYFCCSKEAGITQFGKKTYNEGKVFLINNAIEINEYKFDLKKRNELRKKLNISKNTFVIGHLGRFVPTKNQLFLLEIFNEIHQKNSDSILIFAGKGPLMSSVIKRSKELNLEKAVLFLGQRNDAKDLYQVFDVLVLPSLYEGLPVVGIEAQASNLLCFFSDNVTLDAKILNSTNFVSLLNNSMEWATKIINEYEKYDRNNYYKLQNFDSFNIDNEAKKLTKLYISLLENEKVKL